VGSHGITPSKRSIDLPYALGWLTLVLVSVFDPAHGARVLTGPAPRPQQALPVRIDAQGQVYALVADRGSEQAVGHGRVPGQAVVGPAAGDKVRNGPQ
jgi:hypothetical protein